MEQYSIGQYWTTVLETVFKIEGLLNDSPVGIPSSFEPLPKPFTTFPAAKNGSPLKVIAINNNATSGTL